MKISHMSNQDILNLSDQIKMDCKNSKSLKAAAQKYMNILFKTLKESIILSRIFATIPNIDLPESNKKTVCDLAKVKNLSEDLNDETMILSLLGSTGIEKEWNDVQCSQNHIGIPLLSKAFIDEIPMMSRLLNQMGLNLSWIDSKDTDLVVKTMGSASGVFYVEDARKEVDMHGRKIIAAQDFVEKYDVKTVFGLGGGYLGSQTFFTIIVFCNEYLTKDIIEKFITQANYFKTSTLMMVDQKKYFV